MAASIVNALSRELHALRQQVDTVKERVLELESSTNSADARLSTLETEHWSFRRYLIDVHMRLDDGGNRSRQNNLRLRGIPEATMGPDLRFTVVAILNQILGKLPSADLELDRAHRVLGPRALSSSQQGQAFLAMPWDIAGFIFLLSRRKFYAWLGQWAL